MSQNNKIRLAKFLAEAGVASRRKAEELILSGKVKVSGHIVKDVATKISPASLEVKVNNQPVILEEKVYYLVNKPVGYLSSASDPHHHDTVTNLVPKEPRVFPVGRLDKESQGLMILTNDGELAYQLTHPKFEVKKIYLVKVNKKIEKDLVEKMLQGLRLTEGKARADKVIIKSARELEIIIHQGWKRQIRRMLEKLGYETLRLERIAEGKIKLGRLAPGKYKILSRKDFD